jgi:hypothetical protein
MTNVKIQNFDRDGEHADRPHARVSTVKLLTGNVNRLVLEPGWKWSVDIAPLVGTETCQVHHMGYVAQGTVVVLHSGEESSYTAGDVYEIAPGHDAWVVGDTPAICYEFSGVWLAPK